MPRFLRVGAPGKEKPAVLAMDNSLRDLSAYIPDLAGEHLAPAALAALAKINEARLWLDVNDERMQDGNTNQMIFSAAEIVSYVSQFMLLRAGDVITTGTPNGVGLSRKPPRYLKTGDRMRLSIDGLGIQQQRVIPHPSAAVP
jgi:2-keto-4-pentenoate hydratase/2-oxohepta-3-ene-1,7-dioic acid hydratase in catechol pathway